MADRTPRNLETRAVETRPEFWRPPELLPEPDKQAGYTYRWVRVSLNGNADPRNVSSKLREGWEPVKLEEQPQFQMLVDPNSRFKDNVEVGGLLLCKIPEEFMKQRAAYFDDMSRKQTESVDNNLMRQSDPRMPIFNERRSTVSFGKGS
jgi:hypothetical protein